MKEIIGYKQRQKKQVNLVNICKQRICSFENYFEFLNTTVNATSKNILFRLPKLKLEYGCRLTKYLGAKTFNDLPIKVLKHYKEKNFNGILSNYFLS